MPELSIVIPALKEEKTLPNLLDTIKAQRCKDLEIIVADAFSPDKTRKIAEDYGCRVVDGGPLPIGRNNGAKIAKGEFLCFIDADVMLPDRYFLGRALKEMKARKLDLAGTLQKPDKTGNLLTYLEHSALYGIGNLAMLFGQRTTNPFMQVCMFAKKESFGSTNGFPDYEFGEDSAFAQEAVNKYGQRFGILTKCGKVYVSPRRLDKTGFWTMTKKYARLNALRLMGKEFPRGSMKYYD